MRVIEYPDLQTAKLLCVRPEINKQNLFESVRSIFESVATEGDSALLALTEKYDRVMVSNLRISSRDLEESSIPPELEAAIETAAENIRVFHSAQRTENLIVTTHPGINCFRKKVSIDTVGLYIPGGSAPLISSLLMLGIPALLAGCKNIIVCTPPTTDGTIHPGILATARLLGLKNLFAVGGAQAIAAMALGTESIPKVDKIFGPGNQYVSAAKSYASLLGTAIDLPAGPSEVMVIADADSNPAFVAADLLSQAEHGRDSQVILIAWDRGIIDRVLIELEQQLAKLPRQLLASESLKQSLAILVQSEEAALELSNTYAPEHLILSVKEPQFLAERVTNAGSVFLGYFTPEALGDYASGTNHVLPTNGAARAYSGVSLESFSKSITFQEASLNGLRSLGPTIVTLAQAEGLEGHAQAVLKRLP